MIDALLRGKFYDAIRTIDVAVEVSDGGRDVNARRNVLVTPDKTARVGLELRDFERDAFHARG